MADRGSCLSGGDLFCVLFWSVPGLSWPDPKSACNRGLLRGLRDGVVDHVPPFLFVAVVLSLFVRVFWARGVERQQLKWLANAAAGCAGGVIL